MRSIAGKGDLTTFTPASLTLEPKRNRTQIALSAQLKEPASYLRICPCLARIQIALIALEQRMRANANELCDFMVRYAYGRVRIDAGPFLVSRQVREPRHITLPRRCVRAPELSPYTHANAGWR